MRAKEKKRPSATTKQQEPASAHAPPEKLTGRSEIGDLRQAQPACEPLRRANANASQKKRGQARRRSIRSQQRQRTNETRREEPRQHERRYRTTMTIQSGFALFQRFPAPRCVRSIFTGIQATQHNTVRTRWRRRNTRRRAATLLLPKNGLLHLATRSGIAKRFLSKAVSGRVDSQESLWIFRFASALLFSIILAPWT